jgi:hypothetical protein
MSAMTDQDPYRVLKVARSASFDEIKVARKRLELKLHPDKQAADASDAYLASCAERLAAVRAAFALIGTEDTRAAFDAAWAEAHPAAASNSVCVAVEDDEVMDTAEFWATALHSLAAIVTTATAWPVFVKLAQAEQRRTSVPFPLLMDAPATFLTTLVCSCVALTVPVRLPPAVGLSLSSFVFAAAAAAHYPVQDSGVGLLLVAALCFLRRAGVLFYGAQFCAAVVVPVTALLLWSASLVHEPLTWLLFTWALVGATYALLSMRTARDRGPTGLLAYVGVLVGLGSRVLLCPPLHRLFEPSTWMSGLAADSPSNSLVAVSRALTWHQLQTELDQCARSGALDALATTHATWLLVLGGGLYLVLLTLLTASSIPFQEPLAACRSCNGPAERTCLNCDALFCKACYERRHRNVLREASAAGAWSWVTGRARGPNGLKWQKIGDQRPRQGMELKNPRLAAILATERKLEITISKKDWDACLIARGSLRSDHFIKSGSSYFQPAGGFKDVTRRVKGPWDHYDDFLPNLEPEHLDARPVAKPRIEVEVRLELLPSHLVCSRLICSRLISSHPISGAPRAARRWRVRADGRRGRL